MKLYAERNRNYHFQVYDANGVRLENLLHVDTESGWVEKYATNSFGEPISECGEFVREDIKPPGPLRIFDTKLNMEITSQLQIDFIERSRASARAANRRWENMNKRANLAFDQLAWDHGIPLGRPITFVGAGAFANLLR